MKAPSNIIFHFGPPKTGSTSIQELLRVNEELLAPYAMVSPRDNLTKRVRRISRKTTRFPTLMNKIELNHTLKKMVQKIIRLDFDTLIISDENLLGVGSMDMWKRNAFYTPTSILKQLERRLPNHHLTYVVYTRELGEWHKSGYNQSKKRGDGYASYDEWAAKSPHIDSPGKLIASIESIAGSRLTVVDMNQESQKDGFLGCSILDAARIPENVVSQLTHRPRQNVGLTHNAEEFVRLLGDLGMEKKLRRNVVSVVQDNQHLFGDA